MEEILCHTRALSPVLGQIGVKEIVSAGAWYIWWQRRKLVRGQQVAWPARTAFANQAFTSNHSTGRAVKAHEISWTKPPWGSYKLRDCLGLSRLRLREVSVG